MPLDPAQDPAPIEIAGYVGADIGWSPIPEHIVAGARVGRGPIAGVLEARVGTQPDELDPLPLTLAAIADHQGWQTNLASLQDVVGTTLCVEVGVPAFTPRFTGGPYAQAGLDLALVRKSAIRIVDDLAEPYQTADKAVFGLRLAAGANLSLGKHASVRAQITDLVRPASILIVPNVLATAEQPQNPPLILNEIVFSFTVTAGGKVPARRSR